MLISNSKQLRSRIEFLLPEFFSAASELVNHPKYPVLYHEHLFLLHSVMRATVPLMQAAVCEIDRNPRTHTSLKLLRDYLQEHIPEEEGHDEWVLGDIDSLGYDRVIVQRRMPSPEVASAVGAQYYWIKHYTPFAILGYIAVVEGYPPTEEAIHQVVLRTGLPLQAFSTLIKHAKLDKYHRKDLDVLLDKMILEKEDADTIGISALHSARYLALGLRRIVERSNIA